MPKNRFQEIVFTLLMVFAMVYAMICYNISLETGGLSNMAFGAAFHELLFMGPIAFILDVFVVAPIAGKRARALVGDNPAPFFMVLAISALSVQMMCPLMSLAATLLIKQPALTDLVATWLQTTALNFPMALCWQLFFAGPVVRAVFGAIFTERNTDVEVESSTETDGIDVELS